MSSKRINRGVAMGVAALMAVTAAGCGDDGDSDGGTATRSVGGDNAISVKPKTIGVLDQLKAAPIDNSTGQTIRAAAKALGWKTIMVDAAGDPQKMQKGAQALVDQGVDGIITISVDGPTIRPGLTAAKAAGIPTCATGGGQAPSDLYTAQYTEDEVAQGKMMAARIVKDDPDARVVVLRSTTIYTGKVRYAAFKEELAKTPTAKIVFDREIDLTDPVGSATKAVEDAHASHPDATAVWAAYDAFTQSAVTAVQRSGKDIKVYSYFLGPDNLANLRKKSALTAVGEAQFAKAGVVCLDQFLKKFQDGAEMAPDALEKAGGLEYSVVDRDNLEDLVPPSFTSGDTDAGYPPATVIAPFVKQWRATYPGK